MGALHALDPPYAFFGGPSDPPYVAVRPGGGSAAAAPPRTVGGQTGCAGHACMGAQLNCVAGCMACMAGWGGYNPWHSMCPWLVAHGTWWCVLASNRGPMALWAPGWALIVAWLLVRAWPHDFHVLQMTFECVGFAIARHRCGVGTHCCMASTCNAMAT